ncbi:hypothetical protein CERSUDRAFT_110285 [Gelatoporia subvermispora B]|uniref:V-type proton ATPase subunit C n=1 Tax=Ceriporiopsis subvermispora (strain B) TaxID=914234 RepID=M2RTD1_CERS8|nr:hypothetical protein CERSUDRAFT_110285 [Gelatoporia subvermispora B]
MPSDQSTWLIAVPDNGESETLQQDLATKMPKGAVIADLPVPSFKTGTLESLISLSDELPKQDAVFTSTVAKIVDTLRSLLNNDPAKLAQHVQVEEQSVDAYLLRGWRWNEGRYGVQRGLKDMVDVLNKEMTSIDNVMKNKLNNYNLAKGQLVQMQRKKAGNLSVRSLAEIVRKEHVLEESEFMETLLVAVPKTLMKDWQTKYERLTPFVVPRSSTLIAQDDEYSLFSVVIFKRVHDDFTNKCRENKYIVRDFTFSEDLLDKQREELETADAAEKELWTELLALSRTNFSEAFQILVHLKVLRLFVESVLRYGLPANYAGLFVKPDPKSPKRTLGALSMQFSYLSGRSSGPNAYEKNKGGAGDEASGEYQTVLEQELFEFVLFEVPWIVL